MHNLEDFNNLFKNMEILRSLRHKCISLIIILITEVYIYSKAFSRIQALNFYYLEYWCLPLLLIITWVVWLIDSQRLFFRDQWKILYWIVVFNIIAISFPLLICPHFNDNIPYVQIWGTIIWGVIWYFVFKIIKQLYFKDNRLIIVFAVASEVNESETTIRDSIMHAINNIENRFHNIRIVVPPFGYKRKLTSYEKYIKRDITQADGLIYAQIIEGKDDGCGFVFTQFTSRVNESRYSTLTEANSHAMNNILTINGYKEWNNINRNNNNIISKWKIADNLEGMLLMYCSALYMLKNDYITALPIAKQMYSIDVQNRHNQAAAVLLSTAYLISAMNYEHKNHDYRTSYNILNECIERFPALKRHIWYLQAMARLHFYLDNDLKKSKAYTKAFKDEEGCKWAYNLNMGFYAIYEHKVDEFVNRYKKLLNYPSHKNQVLFAIEFLEHEKENTKNEKYLKLLSVSLAFLYTYINHKKSKKYRNIIQKKYQKDENYKKFEMLLQLVVSKRKSLLTTN